MKEGGLMTTDNIFEEQAYSKETFNGSNVFSEYDSCQWNAAFWRRGWYSYSEKYHIDSEGISNMVVTLVSSIVLEWFGVLIKLPSCEAPSLHPSIMPSVAPKLPFSKQFSSYPSVGSWCKNIWNTFFTPPLPPFFQLWFLA